MLRIEDLHVEVGGRPILKGVDLHIKPGETHVLFGPNGSGKSTLLGAIMGFKRYRITGGRIVFKGEDITNLSVHERARLGIGVAFQRPPVLRGVSLGDLLRVTGNGRKDIDELALPLHLETFLERDVNYGFSGGEVKRSEMLQLLAQSPDLVLLDEPESGVDLENIATIGEAINQLLWKDGIRGQHCSRREFKEGRQKAGLIITHTGYILDYVPADLGHVLFDGRLSCSGLNPRELLGCIQKVGYADCLHCLQ
ncbi:FeS assembly ATPase SufC [Thermacetogenium phaeum DSM 12270]|uniref:FeS assembly ATPase SufC n=1 Tax=Thermacetogenium phaeum (strain ATCC BAA-254 / DSM 26808 / PB) TaxID=1089553 RepID=K4LSY3_THEPS|nr:ABC transporter ATP-binding protein [Thermacetogenium phaeum]AFV11169.1 FeS assembly ATPase SufC [Thermacetogenium phaeum DSM 12270]MDK2880448.1 Fe-S cluster assembly ATP-binding protein [Clostridia bacterium]MDN5366110.1 Fe-S cluster assembly ATP-binding protein [Thermacetogenium sp.]MDN5375221.1 Fe-S cluster assembly ATP-binding protein [Thermacetogenium sp.]